MSTPKITTAFTRGDDGRSVHAVTTIIKIGAYSYLLGGPDVETLIVLIEGLKEALFIPSDMTVNPALFQTVKLYSRTANAKEVSMKHAYRKDPDYSNGEEGS